MRNDRLLLLGKSDVEALLQPADVLQAVREAFVLHSDSLGRVFPVVREALPGGGVFGIKSGDVPSQGLLGFKAAGFWPANRALGGEPHQATIVLFDPATGRPVCIVDGNAVTTLRTGAAGALGLRQFARADSERLCVFGTGVQARVQVQFALREFASIRSVRYLGASGRPDAAFEAALKGQGRCEVLHCADADDAVAASDIVITATPGGSVLFSADAVRPGTHINAVGADTRGKRELPEGLIAKSRLVVDDQAQARQIGESQWAPMHDALQLGDLLTGRAALDRRASDITVFDMTGLALQDLTVARMLKERAETTHTGTSVPWPW